MLLFLLGVPCLSSADVPADNVTVVTYRTSESAGDPRYAYDRALIRLALETTRASDGDYRLVASPPMNFDRAKTYARSNLGQNFLVKQGLGTELEPELMFLRFPVELGIVGFRICFLSDSIKDRVAAVESLEELKQFSFGQGLGWSDGKILRHHGFNVVEIADYDSLFPMVAANRFDLFCRGANEVLTEYRLHEHLKGFAVDESFVLIYPLPRFFVTHKDNAAVADRIMRGLVAAFHSGAVHRLWLEYHRESIEFTRISQRRLFLIENPLLRGLDRDFEQYFFIPVSPESSAGN